MKRKYIQQRSALRDMLWLSLRVNVSGALTPAVLTIWDNPTYCICRQACSGDTVIGRAASWQLKTMLAHSEMSELRANNERTGEERRWPERRRGQRMRIKDWDHGMECSERGGGGEETSIRPSALEMFSQGGNVISTEACSDWAWSYKCNTAMRCHRATNSRRKIRQQYFVFIKLIINYTRYVQLLTFVPS